VFAGFAHADGDANRTGCAVASEASPGFRSYLPDCRAYELVSPSYKEGGVLQDEPAAISVNGETAIMGIAGATAGVENESYDPNRVGDIDVYRLTRGESGWQSIALTPPASRYERSALLAISADPTLSTTLWGAQTGSTPHKEDLYLQQPGGGFVPIGPGEAPELANIELGSGEELSLVGASGDLTRSVFAVQAATPDGHDDLWPGDTTQSGMGSLYEYVYSGIASPEPLLVGVKNQGPLASNKEAQLISDCGTELGAAEGASTYNAVSQDGETVFFTVRACGGSPAVDELYARIGASKTVDISEPAREDCEACNTIGPSDAAFVGASQSGERAFFMTEQELMGGQKGMNLYEYDFKGPTASESAPDGKIALVSSGSSSPEVQGVVRISEDGSHVYFVAKGKLTSVPNPEGREPLEGAFNLYDAQAGEAPTFVATLLTPAQEAEASAEEERIQGEAFAKAIEFWEKTCPPVFENFSCIAEVEAVLERELHALGFFDFVETINEDRSVWGQVDRRPAQATPDGRFLVFLSSADLTADDTSKVPQLFEYDAATGRLTRVSIGQGKSFAGDGNVSTFTDAPQIPLQSFQRVDLPTAAQFHSALSADGSRVFFTSAAPLTPLAVSNAPSVFEYREGDVYLISGGNDASHTGIGTSSVRLFGASASGGDVIFTTASPLVPQQTDSQQALYDAREQGGFPAPVLAPGCMGETCRGPSALVAGLPSPGSVTQGAGENAKPSMPAEFKHKAKRRPKRHGCKRRKGRTRCHARKSRIGVHSPGGQSSGGY
jgi:hypothetical protein